MKYTPQLLICSVSFASAFHNWPKGATRVRRRLRQVQRLRSPPLGAQVQLDNPWTTCDTALGELFEACQEATIPAPLDSNEGSHDSSRWEWGTWVNLESLENLMVAADTVAAAPGAWATLSTAMESAPTEATKTTTANTEGTNDDGARLTGGAMRVQLAGDENWHVALIALPPSAGCQARWPTGSFTLLKALSGMAEVSMVRGDTRLQARNLRGGGGDGSLGSGSGGGDNCVKFLGGPLREMKSKGSTPCLMLEIAVRPPIGGATDDGGAFKMPRLPYSESLAAALTSFKVPTSPPSLESKDAVASSKTSSLSAAHSAGSNTDRPMPKNEANTADNGIHSSGSLRDKLSLGFEQVGGLDAQLDGLVRRVLASRANPLAAKKLGVSHVRGVLLSGPPGCGKTLLARELAKCLGAREPQIVNGPEILDKFVGEAEKKVRSLFYPAEAEYAEFGDASALHVVIFDEMDAIARRRGSLSGDTTGVRDSVVNQLLAKMDGVVEASNVLVVGLTNRPELLDEALLRPGRLEVHLKVQLPDARGRAQILNIHSRHMRANGALSPDALALLEPPLGVQEEDDGSNMKSSKSAGFLADSTELFSGAELAGLVRSAASFALARTVVENGDGTVTAEDFHRALRECQPALRGDESALTQRFPNGIAMDLSPDFSRVMRDLSRFTASTNPPSTTNYDDSSTISKGKNSASAGGSLRSLLLVGGGDGSGVTALAAYAAHTAVGRGDAGVVRFVDAISLLAESGDGSEGARAAALVDQFNAAKTFDGCAMLILDDVDQLVAGSSSSASSSGAAGLAYSPLLLSTLRALLRQPMGASAKAQHGDELENGAPSSPSTSQQLLVVATTSRRMEACGGVLTALFEEAHVVPMLNGNSAALQRLLEECGPSGLQAEAIPGCAAKLARATEGSFGTTTTGSTNYEGSSSSSSTANDAPPLPLPMGVKAALRLTERAVAIAGPNANSLSQENALAEVLIGMAAGSALTGAQCDV